MNAAQRRAVAAHRHRLTEQGVSRYEVRGLERDKELVRHFAKRLVANDADAERLRAQMLQQILGERPPQSGIWAALRRSPAVGANLDLTREEVGERDADL